MLVVTELRKSFLSPEGGAVEIVNVPAFTLEAGATACAAGRKRLGQDHVSQSDRGHPRRRCGTIVRRRRRDDRAAGNRGATGCAPRRSATFSRPSICSRATPASKTSCSAWRSAPGATARRRTRCSSASGSAHRLDHYPAAAFHRAAATRRRRARAREPAEARARRRTDGQSRPQATRAKRSR